ncbi:hypothetical protein J2S74_002754 [Evansella vedderi]|uniref:Uncharacterized protein n=1 Tax=Evansella vedderi TaxID=38282 RepID=A0ABT9ZXB1_9BACI|nr:hypothetical protein [Evansella vedderi]MDQ0255372.1 hypothetical protein [Evansella vedderi]
MSNKYQKLIKNKEDKILQLNQKILHYRSELEKYKRQIIFLSKRGQQVQQPEPVQEPKEESFKVQFEKHVHPIIAYFNYATFLEENDNNEKKLDVFGNLTFQNLSDTEFQEPVICIRVKPIGKISIGGKINISPRQISDEYSLNQEEQWVYVQENWRQMVNQKGEHWLKPLHLDILKPFEKLKFSNFNISFNPAPEYSHYVVEGFFYARNYQKGIPAINTVSFYL